MVQLGVAEFMGQAEFKAQLVGAAKAKGKEGLLRALVREQDDLHRGSVPPIQAARARAGKGGTEGERAQECYDREEKKHCVCVCV